MAIKLKSKVAWGGIFLFALLILVGAVTTYYFNQLSKDTSEIVKDNYETLNYTKEILLELDALKDSNSNAAVRLFETTLQSQEKNITEPGEKEMTASLRKNFEALKADPTNDSLAALARKDISGIMQVNLQAIDKKNQAAQESSENAKTVITVILTICLLTGITFLYNFPSLIASPVAKLTEGITAIANKNYRQRVHLNRNDEFGELATAFNTMAERLDEYEHSNLSKILFEKQRAEAVINSLKDASICIDSSGIVLFANQQALQLLNLKEQDIIGLSQADIKKNNDLFRHLVDEQGSTPFKIVVDGKENYFTKEQIDLRTDSGGNGYVIVLKNITPFKELDVAKTNFIATVSHELKTPLASSDFSLKLLEDERIGSLTPEQKELVQHLKEDNKRLLRILSELLDLSQMESGKIQLHIQPVNPVALVNTTIDATQAVASAKQIHLHTIFSPDLPLIKADADKTAWVLNNLLTNALRYSPNNEKVTISVTLENSNVIFQVSDSGPGIEEQYHDKIFDRYFRVPGTKEKGTGLGLSISREFIEAQGGRLWLAETSPNGSTFCFSLPATV